MSSARAAWVALGVGALASAFAIGTRFAASPAPRAPEPAAVVERPGAPVIVRGEAGLSRDELRAVVREELAARAGAATGGDGAAPDPAAPTSAERAAERRSAVAAASAVVATGVERGVWGERERAELRVQLAQLGPAETHEVLTPLFQAINAQRIQLDGPPL